LNPELKKQPKTGAAKNRGGITVFEQKRDKKKIRAEAAF
jgi:hypothetical protein